MTPKEASDQFLAIKLKLDELSVAASSLAQTYVQGAPQTMEALKKIIEASWWTTAARQVADAEQALVSTQAKKPKKNS